MIVLSIQASGKTMDDLSFAIDEISKAMYEGFTSGANQNDDGSYTFQLAGDEEEGDG